MSFKNLLILPLLVVTTTLFAQQQNEVYLLDLESSMPIVGATFQYGDQNGVSDNDGILSFYFSETDTMFLSHVSYGTWKWTPEEVNEVILNKVYYRSKTTLSMYPVTVVAVRNQNQQPDERLNIDYQERMEHDGAAVLSKLPSISTIRKSGSYGIDPVFRGYKYDQLNIVLNGAQGATAACPNRMDPPTSQMAPNMLDRIEVLKGPYALRYGTGIGATINFIPAKLRFTSDPEVYGRVSSGVESNGTILRGESQIGVSSNVYDASFFASWSQGDDYTSGNGTDVQAGFMRSSFGSNLGFKLTEHQQLRVSSTYNMARDAEFAALPMDLRSDDTWMFNARHDIQVNGEHLTSWNTTLFGSFVDHKMDNLLKVIEPRMMNAETVAKTHNYGGRTEGIWNFTNAELFTGLDLRVEGADGTRIREFLMGPMAGNSAYDNVWQEGQISKTGAFAEYHLHGEGINYILSTRLELNKAVINDQSTEFAQAYPETEVTEFNPSFSAGLQKIWNSQFTTGLWLGRVQRSGSLTERFINYFPVGVDPYEMIGDPNIALEVNNQIDLIFDWNTNNSALNVDLFASYLQDYISSEISTTLNPRLPTSPGVREFMNIDNAFKTGFEFNWTQNLGAGLQQQLGLAYTYAQDLENDEPLPEIPPLDVRYVLKGSFFNDLLLPEVFFRYSMKQDRVSAQYGETTTPSFTLLDLKLGYKISRSLRVNAGVNNVFDENYYEHLTRSVRGTTTPIYAPGRNMFINFSLNF